MISRGARLVLTVIGFVLAAVVVTFAQDTAPAAEGGAWFSHPAVRMILEGILVGIAGDIAAFRAMKDFSEFSAYKWSTALFRAIQGGIVGVLVGYGLIALNVVAPV